MSRVWILACAGLLALWGTQGWGAEYYVNDTNTVGDVFCAAAGNDANDGTAPDRPKASLSSLLTTYTLQGGDTVWIDTGHYRLASNAVVAASHSGASNLYVVIRGSTNWAMGGTVLDRGSVSSGAYALYLNGPTNVLVRDLLLKSGYYTLYADLCRNLRLENVFAQDGLLPLYLSFCRTTTVEHCRFTSFAPNEKAWMRYSDPVTFNHCTFWGSGASGLVWCVASSLHVSNSLFANNVANHFIFDMDGLTTYEGDYNNFFLGGLGYVARRGIREWYTLHDWQTTTTQDVHTLNHDPFINADGTLKSVTGTWTTNDTWVAYTNHSPCIDMAAPDSDWSLEPAPHGGRANIGAFGGTPRASKSRTNAWLLAVTPNERILMTTGRFVWAWGNLAATQTVHIQLSTNAGAAWTTILSNLSVTNGEAGWDPAAFGNATGALWRVILASDTGVQDPCDAPFAIHVSGIAYYVNDESTTGDVFCTAAGAHNNSGLSPGSPRLSIQSILNDYLLGPDDAIWVDTGDYTNDLSVVFLSRHAGAPGHPIRLRGNPGGGSVLRRAGGGMGVVDVRTHDVQVQDLEIRPRPGNWNDYGVRALGAERLRLENVAISTSWYALVSATSCQDLELENLTGWRSINNGIELSNVVGVTIRHSEVRLTDNGVIAWQATNVIAEHARFLFNEYGLRILTNSTAAVQHCTIASNQYAAVLISGGRLSVSNSILVAPRDGACVTIYSGSAYEGDYNDLYHPGSSYVGWRTATYGVGYIPTLDDWRRATGQDLHSLSHDPLFRALDTNYYHVHLRSLAGTWTPSGWQAYPEHSPCIDLADPAADWNEEPAPNGSRANIGAYGNTAQASKSREDPWLLVLSWNDGGVLQGTGELRWAWANLDPNDLIRLDASLDNGVTWTTLVENLAVSNEVWTWNAAGWPNAPNAFWRAVLQTNDTVADTNDVPFYLRTGPANYYVNDASTIGDVYSTAPGSLTNSGLSPSSPQLDPIRLVNTYRLMAGDTLWVDTGSYNLTNTIYLGEQDGGADGVYLVLQGSTNEANGGSLLNGASGTGAGVIHVRYGGWVAVRKFYLLNSSAPLRATTATNILFEHVRVRASSSSEYGMQLSSVREAAVRNSRFWNSGSYGLYISGWNNTARVDHCTFQGNGRSAIYAEYGKLYLSNSVVHCAANGYYCVQRGSGFLYDGDYNVFFATNGAKLSYGITTLRGWQDLTGADAHSLVADPLLTADGHLRSVTGTFQTNGTWTAYAEHSPAIDFADPLRDFAAEPDPNGARANAGAFGGTYQASKSRTNAWLLALTYNDGGIARSADVFRWVAGNMSGRTVRIEYSADNGLTWTTRATGIAVEAGEWAWTSNELENAAVAFWRVVDESDTNTFDQNDQPFMMRSGPMSFYVNDGDTNGDVYCTAVGSAANLGDSPSQPKAHLSQILAAYPLAPGDCIWIDTGSYTQSVGTVLTSAHSGTNGLPLTVRGSTNAAAGGSVLYSTSSSADVLTLSNADYVVLSDLTLAGGRIGLKWVDTDYAQARNIGAWSNAGYGVYASWPRWSSFSNIVCRNNRGGGFGIFSGWYVDVNGGAVHDNLTNGVELSGCDFTTIEHFRSYRNGRHGVYVGDDARDLHLDSCTVWSNGLQAVEYDAESSTFYTFSVSNTVLAASGLGHYAIRFAQGAEGYSGDYNDLRAVDGACVGFDTAVRTALSDWQRGTGQDSQSLSHDPLLTEDGHPQSLVGTWSNGVWVSYPAHSPCIDLADPAADWSLEPEPNGTRRNMGAFGGTDQASLSRTDAWLLVVSYNSRDTLTDTGAWRWAWANIAPTSTVRLSYSSDNGATWTTVAENVAVTAGAWWVAATGLTGSAIAAWKIELESNSNVWDRSDEPFSVRTRAFDFFVNDGSTSGDVYCTAVGNDANDGTTPATPKASLASLVAAATFAAGDRIWIDTGYYAVTNDLTLTSALSGDSTQNVRVVGSTNWIAGGTLFDRADTNAPCVLKLDGVSYLHVENLGVTGARIGVVLTNTDGVILRRMEVFSNAQHGVWSSDAWWDGYNLVLRHNGGDGLHLTNGSWASLYHTTIFTNARHGVFANGDDWLDLYDSIVSADRPGTVSVYLNGYYDWGDPVLPAYGADYNDLYAAPGAAVGFVFSIGTQTTMAAWQSQTTEDAHSLCHHPLFADVNGHLQSVLGTWSNGTWIAYPAHSPCIDAGRPTSAWTNEPVPNGSRANLGAHGNTEQASLSRTSAWVLAVSLNDGPTVTTNTWLHWRYGNLASNDPVRLDYSPDNGATWTTLVAGLAASNEWFFWNVSSNRSSPLALWRIVSENDTNVWDAADRPFGLRSGPVEYFINDSGTAGDVYCTAPGDDANLGLSADAPKRSVSNLLASYRPMSGDTVWLDTGEYPLTTAMTVSNLIGTASATIRFVGSTNALAGGTWLYSTGGGYVVYGRNLAWVEFHHLRVSRGERGLYLSASTNCAAYNVTAFSNTAYGILAASSPRTRLYDCRVFTNNNRGVYYDFSDYGWVENLESFDNLIGLDCSDSDYFTTTVSRIYHNRQQGVWASSPNRTARQEFRNTLLYDNGLDGIYLANNTQMRAFHLAGWGNARAQIYHSGVSFALTNSILAAVQSNSYVVYRAGGTYAGDYNDLISLGSTNFCYYGSARTNLAAWQAITTQDVHSVSLDPLFANPAAGDFHLLSTAGRYSAGAWVNDSSNSPCIDLGSPYWAFANEPAPNGGVANLGAYGNTAEASKSADTDADGVSDSLEIGRLGTDPGDPDSDDDGVADGVEYVAGTDPLDAGDFLAIGAVLLAPNRLGLQIEWFGADRRRYTLLAKTNLLAGTWDAVSGLLNTNGFPMSQILGSNAWIQVVDPAYTNAIRRDYTVSPQWP